MVRKERIFHHVVVTVCCCSRYDVRDEACGTQQAFFVEWKDAPTDVQRG